MYGSKKVEISGVNTYELPTLSWADMKELFKRVQEGDSEARETLIQSNLKLVLSILKRFKNRGENMDDLFQVGCVGLMKAIDNFKLDHNVNFSTYAVPMILGEIKRYLRDNNYLHMSRSLKAKAQKIQEIREDYFQKHQREPNISELAAAMDMMPEEVVVAYNASMEPLSFFEPVYNDSSEPLQIMELLKDVKNSEELWLENIIFKEALQKLSAREEYVITERFLRGKTQMEVADKLSISQAQVSRIEKSALSLIRSYCSEQGHAKKKGG